MLNEFSMTERRIGLSFRTFSPAAAPIPGSAAKTMV
jgi:hypothetical protein